MLQQKAHTTHPFCEADEPERKKASPLSGDTNLGEAEERVEEAGRSGGRRSEQPMDDNGEAGPWR